VRCAGPLSGRRQSVSDRRRRIPHVVHVSVAQRRLRAGQAMSATRVAQSQLHGTAARLRGVTHSSNNRANSDDDATECSSLIVTDRENVVYVYFHISNHALMFFELTCRNVLSLTEPRACDRPRQP